MLRKARFFKAFMNKQTKKKKTTVLKKKSSKIRPSLTCSSLTNNASHAISNVTKVTAQELTVVSRYSKLNQAKGLREPFLPHFSVPLELF